MSTTSYTDIMLMMARCTEAYLESNPSTTAASGQATVVDTKLSDAGYGMGWADDEFNGGTLFADLNSPTPVIDYNSGASTITLLANLGNNITTSEQYLILSNRYPLGQVRAALAAALAELPPTLYENTSLTTAAATTTYTLNTGTGAPLGAVREVWVATLAASPYNYARALGVKVRRDESSGSAPGIVLEFPYQPVAGRKIKVVYSQPGANYAETFVESGDTINALVLAYAPWLALQGAVNLIRWRTQQAGADLERLMPLLNDLMARAARARVGHLSQPRVQAQPVLPYTEVR